jgi:hypothetical protein
VHDKRLLAIKNIRVCVCVTTFGHLLQALQCINFMLIISRKGLLFADQQHLMNTSVIDKIAKVKVT